MKWHTRLLLVGAGLLLAAGCAHTQLDAGSVRDITRLAVVVRAAAGPTVTVARSNSREGRAFPDKSPADADKALQEVLAKQVSVFEIEERVREALMAKLPGSPPWSTAMSASQVATALQSFLVVDHSQPIDFDALRSAGADAVLELRVSDWGLTYSGKSGLYLKGDGKLYRLPGKSGIWADVYDVNLASDPESDGVDVVALRNGGFREAVIHLVGKLADRLVPELAGKP